MYSYKWFEGAWPQPNYHPEYHDCIKQTVLFPNAQGVTVHFDRHAGGDGDDNLFQDPDFQRIWLRRILSPLRGRINKLALRHYENTGDKGVQPRSETLELMSTLTGVKSFRMSVKHRETSADSGPMYKVRAKVLSCRGSRVKALDQKIVHVCLCMSCIQMAAPLATMLSFSTPLQHPKQLLEIRQANLSRAPTSTRSGIDSPIVSSDQCNTI